jgi:hypothetical protein
MESGGGMDLSTGVFTAPVAGVYEFTFGYWDSTSGGSIITADIRVNSNIVVANLYTGISDMVSVERSVIVKLQARDTVDTYLKAGSLTDNPTQHYTRFTGHILYQE